MSKFAKLDGQDIVVESALNDIVEEGSGWGILGAALILTGTSLTIASYNYAEKSEIMFNKLFSIKEISDYVKKECDKILKEQQKADPSVTQNLPSGIINYIKKTFTDKNFTKVDTMHNHNYVKTKVGTYNIYAIGNFYDIGKVVVMLYSKDRNDFFTQPIPLPPKELIKEIKAKYK